MAYFIFACNFLDGMYTSVHVRECFDLDFAEKKNDRILSVTKINNLYLVSVRKKNNSK